jgi:HD-like signal output (HDOD) protein/ActR/RegA family two-component response regulator
MKILVVDDEEVIRKVLSKILSDRGFSVHVCQDGAEATPLALRLRPDLILMDIEMPGMGGIEAIRLLKATPPISNIPIIILTGSPTPENVLEAVQAGAIDFVVKSDLRIEEFLVRIARSLGMLSAVRIPWTKAPTEVEAKPPSKKRLAPSNLHSSLPVKAPLEERIRSIIELKALPFVVAEVIKIASTPGADVQQLTETISRDPALLARVLEIASSSAFLVNDRILNLAHAVTRLGFRQVREIAVAMHLLKELHPKEAKRSFNRQKSWRHSLGCGVLCRELTLAANLPRESAEEAFLVGLLHNIGQLFLDDHFPEEYAQVLSLAARRGRPLLEVERELLGFDHPEISRRILTQWHLLEGQMQPILLHHGPWQEISRLPEGVQKPTAILWLANILVQASLVGSDGEVTLESIPDELTMGASLTPSKIKAAMATLPDSIDELTQILLLHGDWVKSVDAAPSIREARITLVSEVTSLVDSLELLLRHAGGEIVSGCSVEALSPDPARRAIVLRPITEDWLGDQMEALGHLCQTGVRSAKERLLVVVGFELSASMARRIKVLKGRVLRDPIVVPQILQALG